MDSSASGLPTGPSQQQGGFSGQHCTEYGWVGGSGDSGGAQVTILSAVVGPPLGARLARQTRRNRAAAEKVQVEVERWWSREERIMF